MREAILFIFCSKCPLIPQVNQFLVNILTIVKLESKSN